MKIKSIITALLIFSSVLLSACNSNSTQNTSKANNTTSSKSQIEASISESNVTSSEVANESFDTTSTNNSASSASVATTDKTAKASEIATSSSSVAKSTSSSTASSKITSSKITSSEVVSSKTPSSSITSNNTSSNTSVVTSSTPNATHTLLKLEVEVVELVNKIRADNGLSQLSINTELSKVARIKSQDMIDKKYFDHNSPTYGSPFDMMKTFGIRYTSAGENIAKGYPTASGVVDGWMNSPPHKANILNPDFEEIGVGYAFADSQNTYWTQMFISNKIFYK